MEITVGLKGTVTETVNENITAEKVGSGSLPVFATPMMVALMEKAACKALENNLDEGSTTVGTKVDVEHVAATPVGMEVTVTATRSGVCRVTRGGGTAYMLATDLSCNRTEAPTAPSAPAMKDMSRAISTASGPLAAAPALFS